MTGVWLIQLGTPEALSTSECKKFISEFLMDERVIDIPLPLRWLLVNFIVPRRAPEILKAYQSIWLKDGSPLRVYSQQLEKGVQASLGSSAHVRLSMTYGLPSLTEAWEDFRSRGLDSVVIVPLFPQYASATTGACLQRTFELMHRELNIPAVRILPPFYNEDFFIQSCASIAKKTNLSQFDHFVFSFHGLPERQIKKSDPSCNHCLKSTHCCEIKTSANTFCYRAQSFETAKALSKALQIPTEKISISFQSRLGKSPWIKPYTDEVLVELAKSGKKRIAVFSPSFVADCLETLEEIGIRGRESFLKAGGTELKLIPSLNAEPEWVSALSNRLQKEIRPTS